MAFTQNIQKEHEINDLFESSLKNGNFQVYLQPKVQLEDEKIGGAEALVRWNHLQKGMIYPLNRDFKVCVLSQKQEGFIYSSALKKFQ